MSLQVKFPFGRGQGPLHTCRSCGFGTRHRVLFERHTKRCPAEVQRTASLQASLSPGATNPPPTPSEPTPNLPLPPVCRNYKCEKCPFTTNKSRVFLFHQREVHGENITVYVCDHCEYASRHKNKVYRHRKLVHKDAEPLEEIPSESDVNLQRYILNQERAVDAERVERVEHGNRMHRDNHSRSHSHQGHNLSNHSRNHSHDRDHGNHGQDLSTHGNRGQRRNSDPQPSAQRVSRDGMTGGSLYVTPKTQGVKEERYVVYNDGHHDDLDGDHDNFDGDHDNGESPLEPLEDEGDEDMPDDAGETQNPDPTENAYDYIVKDPEHRTESPVYKCKLCYYTNPHKWKIANHIRTIHMKKTLFKCPFCDFVCERKIEWCVHKTSHTSKVVYSCQECQYRTTMKRNFDRHLARHRSGGPIKCAMCSYSSTGEAAIQRHMAEYHPAPSPGPARDEENSLTYKPPYRVRDGPTPPYGARDGPSPHYGARDRAYEPREAHSPVYRSRDRSSPSFIPRDHSSMYRARDQPSPYSSRDQPSPYSSRDQPSPYSARDQPLYMGEGSKQHLSPSPAKSWTGPSVTNTPVKLPPRFCRTPDQPQRINSFSPLGTPSGSDHTATSPSGSPDVLCPVCGLNVKTDSKLKIHMVSHSSVATWSCPLCPLRYKRAADLNRHMKRKHSIRLCDYRNGVIPQDQNMDQSPDLQERNSGSPEEGSLDLQEQPLDLCVKRAASDDEGDVDQPLDLSMKASPPSPPPRPLVYKPENLKCSHCSYLAKWPSDLRRHMLVHSIEKRFRCQYCNKKYKYQFDLNMHLRKSHKIPAGRTRIGSLSLLSGLKGPAKAPITISSDSSPESSSVETTPVKVTPMGVKVKATEVKVAGEKDLDSLKCKYCKYIGKYRAEVERHMRLHTGKKPYHCLYCVYKSFWKGDMKRHLQKHHSDEIDRSGRDIKALVNQTFRPSDEEPEEEPPAYQADPDFQADPSYQADPATLDDKDLSEYKALLDEDESETTTFSEAYPTYPEFGQTVFPGMEPNNNAMSAGKDYDTTATDQGYSPSGDKEGRESPMEWEDNNNSPRKASAFTVSNPSQSERSYLNQSPDTQPGDMEGDTLSDPKKICKCPKCPFICEAPSKLKCHMEIHDNLKRFMCPHCGKRSNWLWDVRKHIRKDHPRAAMEVREMSEEDARDTLDEYLLKHRVSGKSSSKERSLSPLTTSTKESSDSSILNQMLSTGVTIKQEPDSDYSTVHQRAGHSVTMPVFPTPVAMPVSRGQGSYDNQTDNDPPPALPLKLPKHIAIGRYRPFKCGKCGRRSNWRWDLNKHIRQAHGSAKVIVLSDEEAKATFHECLQMAAAPARPPRPVAPPSPPQGRYRPYKCSECSRRSNWKWDMNKHIRSVHPDAHLIELTEEEARASYHEVESHTPSQGSPTHTRVPPSVPQNMIKLSPNSKTSLTQDIHKLKRFKCSGCPYRSNFRSDIGRHIKRKHRRNIVHVEVLDLDLASATLADYKQTWAKKKFVPSPAKIPVRKLAEMTFKREPSPPMCPPTEPRTLSNRGRIPTVGRGNQLGALRAKVWRCSKCTFKDRNKKVVVKHFRTHSDGTAFMCRLCGDTTDYRSTLVRHVRTKHHREDLVNCIIETAIQDSSEPLGEVQRQTGPPTTSPNVGYILKHYSCLLCGMDTGDQLEAQDHVREAHPGAEWDEAMEEVDKITPAPPEEPHTPTHNLPSSPRTKTRTENTQKSLVCKHCPYRTNKQGLLKIHSTYHRPQPGNKYKCKYCEYYVCASRLLHQHQALHEKEHREQGISYRELESDHTPVTVACTPRQPPVIPQRSTSRARHFCDKCPYVSINKNDFIYHKQFHRPRPSAILKCDHCPYWVNLKRLMTQHMKVHTTQYKLQYYPLDMLKDMNLSVASSPSKSEDSDDEEDAVHVADLKQSIISSKITSVPITPEKLSPDTASAALEEKKAPDSNSVLVVNNSGQVLAGSNYRRHHKCRHCPYTNVRSTNLRLHEKMHGSDKGLFHCSFCDYQVGNKGLLSHHIRVHSREYRPGEDEINDVEMEAETEEPEGEESPEKEAVSFPDRPTVTSDPAGRVDQAKLPQSMEYYVKYDDSTGEHLLEKATLKKWCCEKCPYATMKRSQFEKHVMLHGSNQKYPCEYCDYAVPGYHLLLQHKRLHLMPNPNLLSVQSISNLQKLPEVPADIAAASNYPNTTTTPEAKPKTGKLGVSDAMELYENSTDFSEPKKLYRCDRCPYTNIRRDHLLSHLKFHMIHSDMVCPHCDYSVTKVHLLNQHIKVHFNSPGGEMNALPATAEKVKGKSPCHSPSGVTGSPRRVTGSPGGATVNSPARVKVKSPAGVKVNSTQGVKDRQPEFIDIAELAKTMEDSEELDAKISYKTTGDAGKLTELVNSGNKTESQMEESETAGNKDLNSGSDTETYEPAEKESECTEPGEVDKTEGEGERAEEQGETATEEAQKVEEGDKENGGEKKRDDEKQKTDIENKMSVRNNAGQGHSRKNHSDKGQTSRMDQSDQDDGEVNEEQESAGDERSGETNPEEGASGNRWVCQYCDRNFPASEKLQRHEMQHLVGTKY